MYEIIKQQFESGKSLTQNKYWFSVKREHWPKYFWDLHPMAEQYYHELNPYFLFNFYRQDFIHFSKTVTVRDGYVTFAAFILNYYKILTKLDTHFIIHPDLVPLVPPNFKKFFSVWHISQPKQVKISEAKKIVLFAYLSEEYLGRIDDEFVNRISDLKMANPNATIEAYLPIRKDPFNPGGKESLTCHKVISILKDIFPSRDIKFLSSEKFFETTDFKDTYFYDMAFDNFIVSDNYVHYYVASRGGTINKYSYTQPGSSYFDLALSFHHNLHVSPLPENYESIFVDLLFYKNQSTASEIVFDNVLHGLLRKKLKKNT